MKIDKNNSFQVVRLLLNLIYYKEITDCITKGTIPARESAYKYYGKLPYHPDTLDEDFCVVDLLTYFN